MDDLYSKFVANLWLKQKRPEKRLEDL